jgi:hypothetical protein
MFQPARLVCLVALCALVLAALAPVYAASPSGFQGYFNYRQSNASGTQVALDVTIVNHTGADISDAALVIRNPFQANNVIGAFPGIAIAAGQAANLSQTVTVPQSELQRWQRGASPQFVISYIDASGKSMQHRVELLRRPRKGSN